MKVGLFGWVYTDAGIWECCRWSHHEAALGIPTAQDDVVLGQCLSCDQQFLPLCNLHASKNQYYHWGTLFPWGRYARYVAEMLKGAGVLHLGDRTWCTLQHSRRQRDAKGEKLRAGWTPVRKLICTWNCFSHSSMEIFSDKHRLDSRRSTKCGEIRDINIKHVSSVYHELKLTSSTHREEVTISVFEVLLNAI